MTEAEFKNSVILFAEIMVPDLQQKPELREGFYLNFNQLMSRLEFKADAKIKLLVNLIQFLCICYHLRAFKNLSYIRRKRFIEKLFRFPIGKIVAGLAGLRSLVLISYYGLEPVYSQINRKPKNES